MKILHCCLASFYIDNYSYQENILPKEHKKSGNDVRILASTETFVDNNSLGYIEAKSYVTEDGIPITRLHYSKLLPQFIMKKLRLYKGVNRVLADFKPEIIFMHDCQFMDIKCFVEYAIENPSVKIFVDCHTDFYNSARSWISKNVLHKIIYRRCAKMIEPYTKKFYGVLPARVDFLIDIYKLPKEKVELLVMGAEDEKVAVANNENIKKSIRKKYNIKEDDFLIITGGKLDSNKPQTLVLMQAVKNINKDKIKLLVFGSVNSEYKEKFTELLCDSVQYIGWVNSKDTYKYFSAADLVIFPGLHSVFWEQVVGMGKPCVFKYIEGFTHIDLGGNCKFLYEDSVDEIKEVINEIVNNNELYEQMKNVAITKGMDTFSYKKIAKRSLSDD